MGHVAQAHPPQLQAQPRLPPALRGWKPQLRLNSWPAWPRHHRCPGGWSIEPSHPSSVGAHVEGLGSPGSTLLSSWKPVCPQVRPVEGGLGSGKERGGGELARPQEGGERGGLGWLWGKEGLLSGHWSQCEHVRRLHLSWGWGGVTVFKRVRDSRCLSAGDLQASEHRSLSLSVRAHSWGLACMGAEVSVRLCLTYSG